MNCGNFREPWVSLVFPHHYQARQGMMLGDFNLRVLPVVDLNGPSRLGFAKTCFVCGVIDLPELKIWAEGIIVEQDQPPTILFDILDFNDSKGQFYSLLRDKLVPGPFFSLQDDQLDALSGIGFLRNPDAWQENPDQKARERAALDRHPEILAAFRSEFLFVRID